MFGLSDLEERGLFRTHASVLRLQLDVARSDGTSLEIKSNYKLMFKTTYFGRSSALVLQQLLADFAQVFFGEDEADVANDVRKQALELRVLVQVSANGFADHRVLAHDDFTVT